VERSAVSLGSGRKPDNLADYRHQPWRKSTRRRITNTWGKGPLPWEGTASRHQSPEKRGTLSASSGKGDARLLQHISTQKKKERSKSGTPEKRVGGRGVRKKKGVGQGPLAMKEKNRPSWDGGLGRSSVVIGGQGLPSSTGKKFIRSHNRGKELFQKRGE